MPDYFLLFTFHVHSDHYECEVELRQKESLTKYFQQLEESYKGTDNSQKRTEGKTEREKERDTLYMYMNDVCLWFPHLPSSSASCVYQKEPSMYIYIDI